MDKQQQFHFRDGTSASSLNDLKEKIETISYAEFYHHVNSTRNDFANWIRYVLKDEQLADDLEKTTSIVETVEVMDDYLHPRPHKQEDIQSRIEEQLGIHIPKNNKELEALPAIKEEVPEHVVEEREEITREETPTKQETPGKQQRDETTTPAEETHHYRVSKQEKNDLKEFHHNFDRIIVKDFIWGMIFGLIVGFVLARMLSL